MKKLLLNIALFLLALPGMAQFDYNIKDVPLSERFRYGGYMNLQFGTWTAIDLSPSVGFMVTPRYMTGLGVSFIYAKYNDTRVTSEPSIWYGVRNFNRFFITPNLFAWGEIEWMSLEYQNQFAPYTRERDWFTSYLVGGGYMSRFGNSRGGMYITILFNLNPGPYSPYGSNITPIPRFGVFF